MAGIIHTTVPVTITRRRLMTGAIGVFAGVAAGRAALAHAQDGTPEAAIPSGGPERLASILRMIPAGYIGSEADDTVLFYYADLKRQLDAVGVESYTGDGESLPEGFTGALFALATAAIGFQYGLEPEFRQTFGFSALEAEEALTVGQPPNDLTIYRGGLPLDSLPDAWLASGYASETTDSGVDVWTAGKDGEIDLTSNVSRYGVGAMNNVAILGDAVVFGRYFADVEAVANQVANAGDSLIEQAGLGGVLSTMAEETVSAMGLASALLELGGLMLPEALDGITPDIEASDSEVGPFPPPSVALFSITAGAQAPDFVATGEGTPAASPASEGEANEGGIVQVRLAYRTEEDAATAVANVEYRWNAWFSARTGQPLTELMEIVTAEPAAVLPTVAAIDFRQVFNPAVWIDIVLNRDLLAFAWGGVPALEPSPTAAG